MFNSLEELTRFGESARQILVKSIARSTAACDGSAFDRFHAGICICERGRGPSLLVCLPRLPNKHISTWEVGLAQHAIEQMLNPAKALAAANTNSPTLTNKGRKPMKLYEPISGILERKGCEVWSVAPTAPVFEAILRMSQARVGALLVLDRGKLAGITSERDYARKLF
jgi:hypothetical protein